ncbi:MAG: S46 family peptidase [Bacteroidales bacterium]|nr:S46 family peptidase [Bacteroidales bacterium]
MRKLTSILLVVLLSFKLFADEGMWIPLLLSEYNYEDMKAKGFKLSAEDIYSINEASMKDAIVIFGGGCTGELISENGLLITNHHCGYGNIQKHSSLENDYLTDGFWAKNQKEELSNPGLKVTFLISMEDVTDKVLNGVKDNMTETERSSIINKNIKEIEKEAVEDTHYEARIEKFYGGNQYYLFVNEVFTDVRLVGAPPSAIGKFGGDTDNWMWPRHTGDFSLFRIYTAPDGKPADYAENNIPYKAKKHFAISLKGVEEGDFTMVFGYPGTTEQYISSYAVDLTLNQTDPTRIMLREARLNIINAAMEQDRGVRIQYANKAASISNGWKKWIGEVRGLKRLNAVERKQNFEKEFQKWANSDNELSAKYANILSQYETIYKHAKPYYHAFNYTLEAGLGIEIIRFMGSFVRLNETAKLNPSQSTLDAMIEKMKPTIDAFYKDYQVEIDKAVMKELLKLYYQNVAFEHLPNFIANLQKIAEKQENFTEAVVNSAFAKSVFADKAKLENFLANFKSKSYKKLESDPFFVMYKELIDNYREKVLPEIENAEMILDSLNRIYMKAQMEFQPNKLFYPDANFTLRVTYGNIKTYYPYDAVKYNWFTTLEGIMEKDNPEIYDYDVPDKLIELYNTKDYGPYADADGKMHVCFTASNHTTGGNSGSPVINANGELIGVNFDRNWHGTMSDIMYDPDMCRNISIDIRYALFIIDKFADAKHLIDEMTIVK